jgi:glycogen operon protein
MTALPCAISYNKKHNLANGEDNRDGHNDNRSWNCGVESPTDHLKVLVLQDQKQRNFLATLMLAQGVQKYVYRELQQPVSG